MGLWYESNFILCLFDNFLLQELFTPKAEEPDVGCVVVNVELPPMCSGKVRPGPPSDQAQLVSSFINELVMKSDIVDLKQLCIVPTKLAWVLFCDIICLNNDGGLTDACVTALVGALKSGNQALTKSIFQIISKFC